MNQSSDVSESPIEVSRCIMIVWSRVSKAADKSRRMTTEPCGDAANR